VLFYSQAHIGSNGEGNSNYFITIIDILLFHDIGSAQKLEKKGLNE
jgi:hypothetical protein